jgi:hypothetical protein
MSKKNRTGYLTSPTNINAANHLAYLFQVSEKIEVSQKTMFLIGKLRQHILFY